MMFRFKLSSTISVWYERNRNEFSPFVLGICFRSSATTPGGEGKISMIVTVGEEEYCRIFERRRSGNVYGRRKLQFSVRQMGARNQCLT